ncbi:MAG: helix-turn-helix domain-containing protein [Acidimicrobiales bacterium]
MSLQVVAWAIEHQDLPADQRTGRILPSAKLCLIALANHASRDGTDSFPSIDTICWYTGLSERAAQYALRALEDHGTITKTPDPLVRASKIKDPRKRPQSYDIAAFDAPTGHPQGCEVGTPRGAKSAPHSPDQGCKISNDFAPEPVLDPVHRKPEPTKPSVTADAATPRDDPQPPLIPDTSQTRDPTPDPRPPDLAAAWEQFWHVYPRKVAKIAARRAWDKAVEQADPDLLIAGARRYADQQADPMRRPFTKHPATWLRGGCWDDEPEPDRPPNGHVPYQDRGTDDDYVRAARTGSVFW